MCWCIFNYTLDFNTILGIDNKGIYIENSHKTNLGKKYLIPKKILIFFIGRTKYANNKQTKHGTD